MNLMSKVFFSFLFPKKLNILIEIQKKKIYNRALFEINLLKNIYSLNQDFNKMTYLDNQ